MLIENNTGFWKRLKQIRTAMISLIYISGLVLVAVLAYPLSPDNSKDAHTVLMEIATRKPGFSCWLLHKYPSEAATTQTFLDRWFSGKHSSGECIPVSRFRFQKDSIWVSRIIDEQMEEPQMYAIRELSGGTYRKPEELISSRTFYLGTDRYGRDVLSRLILGTRVSLAVGLIAVFISLSIGVTLGLMSAYFGGITDRVISWLIQVVWAIPTLLLVFAITFVLGKGFWQIFFAVGCTMWVGTARLVRGQVLSIREMDFIRATEIMGYSNFRILFRHILPNILGPTLVLAAGNFASAILIESGLSFLGIGVQPPVSSWGLMIRENYNFIITDRPLLAIIPGIAIMLVVLAFNLLGNGLRDALDVKA